MTVKRHSAGRVSQPSGPVPISDYWINRGLVFLHLGNGLFWTKTQGWMGTASFVGTPKNQTSKYGVAKGFGTTLGTGTTDNVKSAAVVPYSTGFRSIVAFNYINASSPSGRIFNPLGASGVAANNECIFMQALGNGFSFTYSKAGATAWQWNRVNSVVTGVWQSYGITHDQRSTGVTPALYLDGALGTASVNATGTGSYPTSGSFTVELGNRSTDNARILDGMLGPIAIFDHPNSGLSANEHKALNDNIWQLLAARLTRRTAAVSGVVYPSSDITTTGWIATPGPTYFGMLDEAVTDDADYVTSPRIDAAAPLVMGLSGSLAAGSWNINLRGEYLGNSGQVRVVLLDVSDAVVGTSAWQTLTSSNADYVIAVTTTGTATKIRLEVQ